MAQTDYRTALIVGAGSGLSASLARLFREGRDAGRSCGAQFGELRRPLGRPAPRLSPATPPSAARWRGVRRCRGRPARRMSSSTTPSYRTRGPFVELDPDRSREDAHGHGYGGFLVGQAAAKRMLARGSGAILFTGASASVKGYAALGALRDGQVRAARPRAEHGARARARRASMSPTSSSTAASAAARRPEAAGPRPTACSIPTRSRDLSRTCCSSRAAPGPGRSSCGPGWSGSKASKSSLGRRSGSL